MKICPRCMRQFDADETECPDDGTRLREFRDTATKIVGTVLDGRWEIVDKIGEGGMGEVYRARQVNVDREVAVKILRLALASTEQYVARFFREADIATSVQHPHFVSIYDFGQTEDQLLYIAMELLSGVPMADKLRRQRLDLLETLTIASQVCAALSAAHDARIVHRDLKPDNIFLLDVPGGETFVKVLDFGIAKDLDNADKVTRTGQLFGTPEYMSPEQCEGRTVDGRSDLYALGCILYETLTGKSPFRRGSTIKTLLAQVGEDPKTFGELGIPAPVGVEALVMKLLEKHPDNRYSDAMAARNAINAEIERLRANSGEVHVYETVSQTIRPREDAAKTVSYTDLAHPIHLEGILSSDVHEAIEKQAGKRRADDAHAETAQVEAPSSRMPIIAILGALAILGMYFGLRPTEAPAPPPGPEVSELRDDVARAIGAGTQAVHKSGTETSARKLAAALAMHAVALGNSPSQDPTPPATKARKPAKDPRALDGGIGIRTESSMNRRVLTKELGLLACYNKRTDPTEGGDVVFTFQIQPDGVPASVGVTTEGTVSAEVLECMKGAVSGLRFYEAERATVFTKRLTFSAR